MSERTGEQLYELLPAVHRIRDVAQGEPLRALLGVIDAEVAILELDIDRLYDNWFIETCDEWVVPYLGDLLSIRGVIPVHGGAFSQRAVVANTLAYRRGKGTAATLEQLARDVTGWPAKVVEFFELLATTQHLNHVRLANRAIVDLRDANQLELIDTPFDRAAHTADVRHIDNGRGRHNIPNVGIFLWRLRRFALARSTARAASEPPDGRYTFNPRGESRALFNRPRSETGVGHLAGEENVPAPLRRRPLYDELEARRQALVDDRTPRGAYFGPQPVLEVFIRSAPAPFAAIPPEEILICDLSETDTGDWRRPPVSKTYIRTSDGQSVPRAITVAVDPVLGRLAFRSDFVADFAALTVEVSFSYGFSGELGGGPYNRQTSTRQWLTAPGRPPSWQLGVTRDPTVLADPASAGVVVDSLAAAITAWNAHLSANPAPDDPFGLIAVMDSRSYFEPLPAITIPDGGKLAIVAADWPLLTPDSSGQQQRHIGQIVAEDRRPHIVSGLAVEGTADAASLEPGELVLDGLLIDGQVTIAGNLGRLTFAHATLVPARGGLAVGASNARLEIVLDHAICGPIALGELVPRLSVRDSIVDGAGAAAITAPGCHSEILTSTVFGAVTSGSLMASNSIFTELVDVTRRQIGCVRFSYLPIASRSPRRYRCQPVAATAAARVIPQFSSDTYGDPDYGQLGANSAPELRAGADDEGEMGAFHLLQQSHRLANLQSHFAEHLRFGLEAGILFVN
jgi:hypothetical protein